VITKDPVEVVWEDILAQDLDYSKKDGQMALAVDDMGSSLSHSTGYIIEHSATYLYLAESRPEGDADGGCRTQVMRIPCSVVRKITRLKIGKKGTRKRKA
jgi:hypothetical protein